MEGIPLEEVWGLNVVHFLNNLSYLKDKRKHEDAQIKKISNGK